MRNLGFYNAADESKKTGLIIHQPGIYTNSHVISFGYPVRRI